MLSSITGQSNEDVSKNDNEAVEALLFLRETAFRNFNTPDNLKPISETGLSTPNNFIVNKDNIDLLKTPLPNITPPTRIFSVTPNDIKENINPNIMPEKRNVSCNTPNIMTPTNNYNVTPYSRNHRFSQRSNVVSRMNNDYRPRSPTSPYTPYTGSKIKKPTSLSNNYSFQDLVDTITTKERKYLRVDHKRLFPSVIPFLKESGKFGENLFITPPQSFRMNNSNNFINMRYNTPTRFYMTPSKPQETPISNDNSVSSINIMKNDWKDLDKIMSNKNMCAKSDTKNVDLKELYCTLLSTRGKPLMKIYLQLYSVLYIKLKTQEKKKLIRNNINYKIKNLLITYPHLRFYGEPRDFNLTRLQTVPEVLIVMDSLELREKFQSVIVGRAKGSKAAT